MTVRVSEPLHLCALQHEARRLCGPLGHSAVFEAVIAVSELGNRLLAGPGQAGAVDLSLRGDRLLISVDGELRRELELPM